MRGFEEQEKLLEHIQAGVRALDVLEGRVKLDGASVAVDAPGAPQLAPSTWRSWPRRCGRTAPPTETSRRNGALGAALLRALSGSGPS